MNRFSKGAVIAIVAIAVAAGLWRRCARVEHGIAVIAPIGRIADCRRPRAYAEAARQNAAPLASADWSVFGRPETGWSIYAPLVAHEIGAHWPVANAGRFGFVNYPVEPWHWEWTGSQPRPRQP